MSEKKKILIAYATAGIGHKKAALAISEAVKNFNPQDVEVKTIDVLDYTNDFFKWAYPNIYLMLITHLMTLWGALYYSLDTRISYFLTKHFRKLYHVVNSAKLVRFLLEYKPDVVVSTHFLLPDVCDYVEKKYKLKMNVVNVVTDYRAHAFWISDGVDSYVVAHALTQDDLVKKWRVNKDKVKVLGIPIGPKFSVEHDPKFFRAKYGIPENNFVILLLSGGYGVGPMYETIEELNSIASNLSVICICGHNKQLYERINTLIKTTKVHVVNFGYVDTVDELMAASTIYIGKAGGISTAEGITMGIPLVYIRPIPGQESRNARFIMDNKAGKTVKTVSELKDYIKELKDSPEKVKELKKNIRDVRKVNASKDIAAYILRLSGSAVSFQI